MNRTTMPNNPPTLALSSTGARRGAHRDLELSWREAARLASVSICAVGALTAAGIGACGDSKLFPPAELLSWEPAVLLPTTWLHVEAAGFGEDPGALSAQWTADAEPRATLAVPIVAATASVLTLDFGSVACSPSDERPEQDIKGILRVTGDDGASAEVEAAFHCLWSLAPELSPPDAVDLAPNDAWLVAGDHFLLPPEGESHMVLSGVWTPASPGPAHTLEAIDSSLEVKSRTMATWRVPPEVTGAQDGRLQATLRVVNVHSHGPVEESLSVPVDVETKRPWLEEISPTFVRRGQWLDLTGRGLLPPDQTAGWMTLLALEGSFMPEDSPAAEWWTEADAVLLVPASGDGNALLRVLADAEPGAGGRLTGLAARPGVFAGTATPWTVGTHGAFAGRSLDVSLVIRAPFQVVVLSYLPGFGDALVRFGLEAVALPVRESIAAHSARPYEGIGIAFTEASPAAFGLYTVVEIGGRDPNGESLLGLDNTVGKDVGNLRLDDVLGGFNAETESDGLFAWGGIFVDSFTSFSPTWPGPSSPLADPRFDAIFAPFAPELGGTPASATELAKGERREALERAIEVLGALVGGTVAHEVGHALGLTAIEGQYHNEGDNPAWLMDAGLYRPFGERAAIDGEGPEVFSPFDRAYLEDILPPAGDVPSGSSH